MVSPPTIMSGPPPYNASEAVSQEDPSSAMIRDRDFKVLNYPNELEAIPDADFNADRLNLFVAFDQKHNKLSIEDRAFPLHRPYPPTVPQPKPGFVSFIGETGSGKSWILRSLKRGEDEAIYPRPLVAPGRQSNNYSSTSADVCLYADSASAESENPILFLDCEGLRGSSVPSSLKARLGNAIPPSNKTESPRYASIQGAIPRLTYAFSNCIIFVVNERLGMSSFVAKQLTEYSNCGVGGSRHLGFKPALFVVFNKISSRGVSPAFWSVEDSTRTFFENEGTKALLEHYHKIFVIKIPQLTHESTNLVIHQLDELGRLLREQHSEACNRRLAFRLDFTADQFTTYLTRALRVFTTRNDAVFDWLEQSLDQRKLPDSTKIAEDKWSNFHQQIFHDTPGLSSHQAFQDALEKFHSHFLFCIRLHLARHPLMGRTVESIPSVFKSTIRDVDLVISRYVPRGEAKDGRESDGIQQKHINNHASGTTRIYKQDYLLKDKISKYLEASKSQEWPQLSVKDSDSESILFLSKIRLAYSCVGCLNYLSTSLSCGHGFCEECVEDVAMTKDLHRLVTIKCPFCPLTSEGQSLSPRFLPRAAGYRILSLDGGSLRGLPQIKILLAIERKCFNIPVVHLFDFFIGTSVGGELVLALASREPPLTLSNAMTELRNLVPAKIKPKKPWNSKNWASFKGAAQRSTKYSASALEASLKHYFGESPPLLSVRTPPSPHVAVAVVSHTEKFVIPNYTQPSFGDSDDKRRLALGAGPMPLWIAARCTGAAHPYFKGFQWGGEYFLDEGLAVSCPAELAVDETRSLWPSRRMDVLVSVGTGKTGAVNAKNRSQGDHSKAPQTTTRIVRNPETLWAEFTNQHASEVDRVFRLQPVYSDSLPLDPVNNFDVISNEVETWLKTNADQINRISNQLIASLFIFKPSTFNGQSGTQTGSIECRLPPDLSERQAMVNALLHVAHARQPFTFDIAGQCRTGVHITEALRSLEPLSPGQELSIPVTIEHLPPVGASTIDIKLCDMFGHGESRYSISGCPFTIRE